MLFLNRRIVLFLFLIAVGSGCKIRGNKAIDNKAKLKEWQARLKDANVAVKQAWIEDSGADFSHLKQSNISLDSAQASKLTATPALCYRINVLDADLATDKSIKRSLILDDSKVRFWTFKDSLGVAQPLLLING